VLRALSVLEVFSLLNLQSAEVSKWWRGGGV